jgi:hypothetical protein
VHYTCNVQFVQALFLHHLHPKSPIKNKTKLDKSKDEEKEEGRGIKEKKGGKEGRKGRRGKEEGGKRGGMTVNCTRNTRQMSVKFNSRCCNEPLLLLHLLFMLVVNKARCSMANDEGN